jgi:pimeloyl-ACP methyl ester carboxylesterase
VLDLGVPVRCFQAGSGPAVVLVHGLLTNANLWRKVVPQLETAFRCVTLDLPLGSHELPVGPAVDLSPPGLADLIAAAVGALGLRDATLVGNDTGGALCQIAVTRHPDAFARLVLTSCEYRENFPPKGFEALFAAARRRGGLLALLAALRVPALRRLPQAYGLAAKRPIDEDASDSYVLPALRDGAVRDDLRRVLLHMETRYLVEATDRLHQFPGPALVAWSRDDAIFPPGHAEALAATLTNARLEWIEDSYTFSPEDQPKRVADLITRFVRESSITSA